MFPRDPPSGRRKSTGRITSLTSRSHIPSPQGPFGDRVEDSGAISQRRKAATLSKPLNLPQKPKLPEGKEFMLALSSRVGAPAPSEIGSSRMVAGLERTVNRFDRQRILDEKIDKFFLSVAGSELAPEIENFCATYISCGNVIFWEEVPSIQRLISKRLGAVIDHTQSLVAFAFKTPGFHKIPLAGKHPSFNDKVDGAILSPKASVLLFSLCDDQNHVIGVVEIQKKFQDPVITDEDTDLAELFHRRFRTYSKWLLQTKSQTAILLELMQLYETEQFLLTLQQKMRKEFSCKCTEIWHINQKTAGAVKYETHRIDVKPGEEGLVGMIAPKLQIFNTTSNKMSSSYFEETDGCEEAPVLAYPCLNETKDEIHVLVLRGLPGKFFTAFDEAKLLEIAPMILLSFRNALKFTTKPTKGSSSTLDGIQELLPDIGEDLSAEGVVNKAMETLEKLTKAQRSSFYVVDEKSKMITSIYNSGIKETIQVPFERGIIGTVVSTGKMINVADAYDDFRFNCEMDLITGLKTKSMLTIPIVDATGSVVSAVQLLNRRDRSPFSGQDIGVAKIGGTICSLLLNNAIVRGKYNKMSTRIAVLSEVFQVLLTGKDSQRSLFEAVKSLRSVVNCERVTVMIVDEAAEVLVPVAFDGSQPLSSVSMSVGVAKACLTTVKSFIINDTARDARVDNRQDKQLDNIESICCAPLAQRPNIGIGVLECINKLEGEFAEEDLEITALFASMLSLYISEIKVQKVIQHGKVQLEMDKWISPGERSQYIVPNKLTIPRNAPQNIDSLEFLALDWCDFPGAFMLIFHAFEKYKLLTEFEIANSTLFTLIYEVNKSYNEHIPYHNWVKMIDMFQGVMFQFEKAKMTQIFTPLEVLAVLCAVMFAFSGHDGTSNQFQLKAGTAIGHLYSNVSDKPMAMTACQTAIRVLTKSSCDIIASLDLQGKSKFWNIVTTLILNAGTDGQDKVLNDCRTVLKASMLDLNNQKHRLSMLVMVVKSAYLTSFVRPFALAMKWQNLIMQEMFLLGDQEVKRKMDFSSKYHSRDHHNKEQCQIELLENIVIPTFEVQSSMASDLQCLLDAANENLAKWKARIDL